MAHDVFICHSAKDKAVADAACAAIEARGLRCWIAPRDVLPGTVWAAGIYDAIASSRVMVLVYSANSNGSGQVLRELERAASSGVDILPFRIEDPPPTSAVAYYINAMHWLDAMTPPLEEHLEELASKLERLLGNEPTASPALEHAVPSAAPAGKRTSGVPMRMVLVAGAALLLAAAGVGLALSGAFSSEPTRDPPVSSSPGPSPSATMQVQVHLDAPEEGAFVPTREVEVRGRLEGEASETLLDVNGQRVAVTDGTFLTVLEAAEGALRIVVRCAGASVHCDRVQRDVIVDTTPPGLILSSPTVAERRVSAPIVELRGTVLDANPRGLTIDGVAVRVEEGGRFHHTVKLEALGVHTLRLRATDKAGHESVEPLEIEYAEPPWKEALARAETAARSERWGDAAVAWSHARLLGLAPAHTPIWLRDGVMNWLGRPTLGAKRGLPDLEAATGGADPRDVYDWIVMGERVSFVYILGFVVKGRQVSEREVLVSDREGGESMSLLRKLVMKEDGWEELKVKLALVGSEDAARKKLRWSDVSKAMNRGVFHAPADQYDAWHLHRSPDSLLLLELWQRDLSLHTDSPSDLHALLEVASLMEWPDTEPRRARECLRLRALILERAYASARKADREAAAYEGALRRLVETYEELR